ncbi:minor capsid protein [Caenispirillum bisanense]|nr:minor capsid protein [Caenispirillum bisanense]
MSTDPMADALLRYALRVDGLSQDLAARIARDVERVLDQVAGNLSRRNRDDAPFTYDRLQEVRRELQALRAALAVRLSETVTEAQAAVIETAPAATAAAAARLGVSWTAVPVEMLANLTAEPYQGKTWAQWGAALAERTEQRVLDELRDAAALGEGIEKAARRLETVADLSRTSARKLARTALQDAATRTHMETFKRNASLIKGFRFLATLDGRVSPTCRSLSGREFSADSPELASVRPPLHPNCRSLLVPITRSMSELTGGKVTTEPPAPTQPAVMSTRSVKDIPKSERPKRIQSVPAGTTYEDWLRTTDADFQKEVLGPTRYRAWKNGVPLSGMATYDRALTIAELKAKYPLELST